MCEKESLLSAVSKGVVYCDDEDLGRFRGRAQADYTDAETAEFRDELYTMREEEVAGWARSLQLRGIALPEEVRDEVILIVEERRQDPLTKPATYYIGTRERYIIGALHRTRQPSATTMQRARQGLRQARKGHEG